MIFKCAVIFVVYLPHEIMKSDRSVFWFPFNTCDWRLAGLVPAINPLSMTPKCCSTRWVISFRDIPIAFCRQFSSITVCLKCYLVSSQEFVSWYPTTSLKYCFLNPVTAFMVIFFFLVLYKRGWSKSSQKIL